MGKMRNEDLGVSYEKGRKFHKNETPRCGEGEGVAIEVHNTYPCKNSPNYSSIFDECFEIKRR